MVFGWLLGATDNENGAQDRNKTGAGISTEDNLNATKASSSGVRSAASGSAPQSSSRPREGGNGGADGGAAETEGGEGGKSKKRIVLSKSTRLKGYMIFAVASAINYFAANASDLRDSSPADRSLVVAATDTQRKYAMAVSMTTIVITIFCIVVHFDRFTCLRKAWIEAFKPGSRVELAIILFLLTWWMIATVINTSSRGIAGPGKGQYNLYFSSWVNLWTAIWTMDRWLTANGSSSFKTFMDSWPNRSPGWLFMFVLSVACLASVVDVFKNWEEASISSNSPYLYELYKEVGNTEWVFHIFVAAFTLPTAASFAFIELFRVSRLDVENTKSDRENIFEGFTLLLLVLFWIPVVTWSTTPGGLASLVGNAYFFTWFTTIVVIETFVWWIRDWRKGIHDVVRMQEEEYHRAQRDALRKHKRLKKNAVSGGGNNRKEMESSTKKQQRQR